MKLFKFHMTLTSLNATFRISSEARKFVIFAGDFKLKDPIENTE